MGSGRLVRRPLPALEGILKRREGLLGTDAWRVLHRGELDGFDGVIELYGSFLSLVIYENALERKEAVEKFEPVLSYFSERLNPRGVLIRQAQKNPHARKLAGWHEWRGEAFEGPFAVEENGLKFEILIHPQRHPGLFLDQRSTRSLVRKDAAGRRVANLFSYTCSFSVAALAGGAEEVYSVDLANGCLQTGKRNLALNELDGGEAAKFIRADVRGWLDRQLRRLEREAGAYRKFDLIICDPPVYAAGERRGEGFHVEAEWEGLVTKTRLLLSERGIGIFANNHREGNGTFYRKILERAFSEVRELPLPEDFPEVGETHSRTYWCTT